MEQQLFLRGENMVEIVRPFKERKSRVTWVYFSDQDTAKAWMAKGGGGCNGVLRQRDVILRMPEPILNVERKKSSFVVGPKLIKVRGITNALSGVFCDLFSNPWKSKDYSKPKKRKKNMQALGMSVDKELKLFATGHLEYKGIKNAETRSILHHLAKKGISLVSSGVLVTNFKSDGARPKYSGTEIDLVGYDHHKRSFVITEIKVTGKKIAHLKQRNKDAPLVKSCGFRRSEMGRYAAQVACTFLMYANTYTEHDFYSLLVICESDTPQCESFTLDGSLVDSSRFPMIDGF
jgi:hypothetical protein